MHDKKRKSQRTGAYLPYVTARGLELDTVRRQIARFLVLEDEDRYGRFLLPVMEIGD